MAPPRSFGPRVDRNAVPRGAFRGLASIDELVARTAQTEQLDRLIEALAPRRAWPTALPLRARLR